MKKPSKKSLTNKCDKLWREKVIETYGERCAICGKIGVNVHHIVGRANRATRWYVPNGVPLCAGCHTFKSLSAHQNPLWFRNEMILRRGTEWEKDLIKESNKIWNKKYEIKE